MDRDLWSYAYRLYQKYERRIIESPPGSEAPAFIDLARELSGRTDPEEKALLSGVYAMLEAVQDKKTAIFHDVAR